MKLKMRRPMWWSLFELGFRRQIRYAWDEPVAVVWSLMLGFVAFDLERPVRTLQDSGNEGAGR